MDRERERNRAGEKQERNAYGVYSHTRLRLSKPKCISSIPGSRKCKEMPNPHWMPELCLFHVSLEGAPPNAFKTLRFTSVPLKESHRQTGPPLIKLLYVPFPWTEQRFLCSSGNTEEKNASNTVPCCKSLQADGSQLWVHFIIAWAYGISVPEALMIFGSQGLHWVDSSWAAS